MDLNRIKGKAQGFLGQHSDKIGKGIDRAEEFAKGKTRNDGQTAKVDKAAGKLRGLLPDERRDDRRDGPPGAA